MNIELIKHFCKTKYAFPGGYPMYAITNDGAFLCHKCCKDNYRTIRTSQNENSNDGWNVEVIDINYESEIYCENCSEQIEAAYLENQK